MMPDSRIEQLTQTLSHLEKRWGSAVVQRLDAALPTSRRVSSGIASIDQLLGGGITESGITRWSGSPTSGATTLVYQIGAAVQCEADLPLILIDPQRRTDALYLRRCGLAVDQLLVIQPEDHLQAWNTARDIVEESGGGILFLDDLSIPDASHLRPLINRAARSAWLILWRTHSSTPIHGLAAHLLVQRLHWIREGSHITGCRSSLTLESHPHLPAGGRVEIDIPFPEVVS